MSNTQRLSFPVKDVPGVWHFPWMLPEGFQQWCDAPHLHLHLHRPPVGFRWAGPTTHGALSLLTLLKLPEKFLTQTRLPKFSQKPGAAKKNKKKDHIWEAVGTVTTAPEVRQASTIFTPPLAHHTVLAGLLITAGAIGHV